MKDEKDPYVLHIEVGKTVMEMKDSKAIEDGCIPGDVLKVFEEDLFRIMV
jgi:hypothetical protein